MLTKKKPAAAKMLTDGSVPAKIRRQLLKDMMTSGHPATDQVILALLEAAGSATAESVLQEKSRELAETLRQNKPTEKTGAKAAAKVPNARVPRSAMRSS